MEIRFNSPIVVVLLLISLPVIVIDPAVFLAVLMYGHGSFAYTSAGG